MKYVVGYLVVYFGTLAFLVRYEHFQFTEPLAILLIVGGGFTLLAWLITRGADALSVPMPRRGVLWYLIVVAAFTAWGLGWITAVSPWREIIVFVAKMVVFVAVPWLLFDRARPLLRMSRRDALIVAAMSAVLLIFQAVVGRGGKDIANAHLSAAQLAVALVVALIWMCAEAGVVEEYFFRRLLQDRIEAITSSKIGAIVCASLLFGLVHAPGLYLRTGKTLEGLGPSPSLLLAIGYSIVVISPMGFFLGTIWSRTRNIAVVVLIHGMGDLLPHTIPTWRLLSH